MVAGASHPPDGARPRGRRRVGRTVLVTTPILLILAVIAVLALQVRETLVEAVEADGCAAGTSGHAVFLVDARKPLKPAHAGQPGRLLRDVTRGLPAGTELEVYAVGEHAEAPRMLLGSLCKTYGTADLDVATAKDRDGEPEDCDELPAQIPASVRDAATRFCAEREALAARLDALTGQRRGGLVASAHLVEALEETARDLGRGTGTGAVYVFSDMMQHAKWFSHLDTAWTAWTFESFVDLRAASAAPAGERPRVGAGVDATVFYLPRKGATEYPRQAEAHRRFWEAWFDPARLTFLVQAPALDYAGERLMDVPSEAELVGRERERVRYERAELERRRAELGRAEQAFAAERERLAKDREQWRLRESELRREQERLRERQTELASEQARLGAGEGAGAATSAVE